MVQERVSGNGNFDIDAITRLVNADANAPALIDQPFIDPVADAFAADVKDTADEIKYNPGSNLAEEAMQIMNAPGAAKLGAGVLADLRAAVQLQEEKAANGADAFMRGDRVWEERKERDDKDRKEQSRVADIADDLQNAEERRQAEIERQQRADVWNNSDHTFAGQRMSADEWLRMIQWFKQPENRAAWEDAVMAETGQSRDQVRRTGDKIERLDELIEKQSRGEELTAEEQAEMNRLNNDRDVQNGMRIRREQMALEQNRPQVSNQTDAQAAATSIDVTSATETVDASLDVLSGGNDSGAIAPSRTSLTAQIEGQGEFATTAPSLRDHHRAALAATAPLDQPAPQVIASAAPVPPVPAVNAGFDV
ncbi:MAG: hypothetical protein HC788_01580 [Sphingopyxis sp.]|nr:hypothetical protein [Sphingopyxis sp.]